MTRSSHKVWISIACVFALSMVAGAGAVCAADKTKVDQETKRVEQGAKQIGQGEVGSGFKEMFAGVGHTVVEGAKFSGRTMGEFFKKAFSS
jgi:hypothetical protein